jgi:hypothetical protein
VAAAQTRLTAAQGKSVDVTGLSVSQQQELANAHGAVADAQKKATLTGYVAATSAKDLNKTNLSGDQIRDMLRKKTQGLAAAQSQTFGGDLRKWKAQVIDFGATWGEKFAKPLIAIGPALAGVGALVETGFFGKIGRGVAGLTRGIGSVGRSVTGLGKTVTTTATTTTVGPGQAPASAAGEQGLQSAAGALERAAAGLQTAADTLSGAGKLESGAAGGLNASADQLDASARLESGAAGALDESAALLKTGAAGAGAAGGGEAAAGGGAAAAARGGVGKGGDKAAAGVAGAGVRTVAGSAIVGGLLLGGDLNPAIKGSLGQAHSDLPYLLKQYSSKAKLIVALKKDPTLGNRGDAGARNEGYALLGLLGVHDKAKGYAAGGVVTARPGGVPVLAAEGGQDEIIGSAPTIVAALREALGGPGGRRGPDVAHYHGSPFSLHNVTIRAADLSDLVHQLQAEARRANFAGRGMPGGNDF